MAYKITKVGGKHVSAKARYSLDDGNIISLYYFIIFFIVLFSVTHRTNLGIPWTMHFVYDEYKVAQVWAILVAS